MVIIGEIRHEWKLYEGMNVCFELLFIRLKGIKGFVQVLMCMTWSVMVHDS